MELGLACSVCSSLSPLRAATCDRCHAPLAPRPSGSGGLAGFPGQPVVAAAGKGPMGTMQLPTVSPVVASPTPVVQPGAPVAAAVAQPITGPHPAPSPQTPRPYGSDQAPRPTDQAAHVVAQAQRFSASTGMPEALGGAKPAAKTMFFGALQQQAVIPRLVVIKGEGGDGVTYHLSATNHTVGRSTGDIRFNEDLFLNPEHARFTVQGGRLFVKDLGSVNGVFVRIKSPVQLEHGDFLLVGEQLLRLDSAPFGDGSPDAGGTYSYSSPRPDARFRVVQMLAGGGEGRIVSAQGGVLTMGRESNTLNFPNDRFISGRHARLDAASDTHHVILTDTGSRNGTFVRTKGALELYHGDYLFVGQQLLRVEIS
jgi:pSer/pThr/pTyr-binding forkhead associated (FHA) protein